MRNSHHSAASPWHVGSGVLGERIITVPLAHAIHVSGPIEASLRVDPSHCDEITLRVQADDNLLRFVRARLRAGVIQLELESDVYLNPTQLRVTATVGYMRELSTSGVASLDVSGLKAESIALRATGASHLSASGGACEWQIDGAGNSQLQVDLTSAERVLVDVHGASEVALAGPCEELAVRARGTAEVNASMPSFSAERAQLDLHGASRVRVCASAHVTGRVRFPAQLRVAGEARCDLDGTYRRE